MYTLRIRYRTGDSFNSYEREDDIGLVWYSKDLAKAALASLKEQYDLYSNRSYCSAQKESIAKTKDWCIKSVTRPKEKVWEYWEYKFACLMDDGSWRNVESGMWIGYFEELHEARIVELDDPEMVYIPE